MGRPKKTEEEIRPTAVVRTSQRPSGRTPINGYRDRLTVSGKEPGFHYCLVNEDNVPRYESAGYEFVEHDVTVGDRKIDVATQVGGKVALPVGNGVTGYLMRIPQEYYDQDAGELQVENDKIMEALHENLNAKEDGRYGEVKIKRGRPTF